MRDIKRTAVSSIKTLLGHFPCVVIIGTRQVGKTTLLKQIFPNTPFFDLERLSDSRRIKDDPEFFLSQFKEPLIIDEAQMLPELFPALRVAIDQDRHTMGRFLLSGSSSPELNRHIHESLAGRIAIFELGGFSPEESWQTTASPLYTHLKNKDIPALLKLKPTLDIHQLLESCLFGAYPEAFLHKRSDAQAFSLWMENYLRSYIQRDVRHLFPGLNMDRYQSLIMMLASSSGNMINLSDFARSLDVSQPTVKSYLQIAHETFIWRMIPGYHKNIKKRVVKMPKGFMRDTGLLNAFLHLQAVKDMQNHPAFGRIWETFIIETVLKGFTNHLIPVHPFHYRTGGGAEIDLVLEGPFGVIPVEIKSSSSTPGRQLTALERFIEEHNLAFGLLINNAREPAMLKKNIIQIPAGCL